MSAVRAVTFDAGQTIIQLDTAMLAARLREREVVVAPEAIVAAQAAAWRHYEAIVKAGGHETPWQGFMAALVGVAAGVDEAQAGALARWLWGEQPRRNLWRQPVPGMIEIVRELRAAGIGVGVISNSEGRLAELFDEIGWGGELGFVIDSGRVGIEKPDPRIFALALERLGVAAADAVHVGDSRVADVDGARAAGWRAVWFGDAAGAAARPDDDGIAVARDAAALRGVLRAWGVAIGA